MKTTAIEYGVRAHCPDCNAMSYFDWHDTDRREIGWAITHGAHEYAGRKFTRTHWRLLRCSGCGRAGLAKFHDSGALQGAALESFYPNALPVAPLPTLVSEGVRNEYREAELCFSVNAWRGASALLRSALEKALKENGYSEGSLQAKIDQAAADGVITAARSKKAHEDVRVLGNEIVHDAWRQITDKEVESSLHYVQRVLEDLYDDRPTVEAILREKKRLAPAA